MGERESQKTFFTSVNDVWVVDKKRFRAISWLLRLLAARAACTHWWFREDQQCNALPKSKIPIITSRKKHNCLYLEWQIAELEGKIRKAQ